MSHFHFHKNGGPFPGTCIRCGNNKELWQLGNIPASNMAALLCDRCLTELAIFTGFVTSKSYAEQYASMKNTIDTQAEQLKAAPKLMEKFQNDVSSVISDFVTSIASISVPREPVQPKGDQADDRSADTSAEVKPASRSSKSKGSNASTESSSE